jgi:hypothetical protein
MALARGWTAGEAAPGGRGAWSLGAHGHVGHGHGEDGAAEAEAGPSGSGAAGGGSGAGSGGGYNPIDHIFQFHKALRQVAACVCSCAVVWM